MYDVRGIADIDLSDENVYLIGKAFGTYIKRNGGKLVTAGMDVRLSSARIKTAFIKGVSETGLDVIDTGTVTTPMLYYAMHKLNADGGIMVTGSHNPIEYNGLKMVDPGVTIYGDTIQKFYTMIENSDFDAGNGKISEESIYESYILMCIEKIKISKPMKIAVDPGNG